VSRGWAILAKSDAATKGRGHRKTSSGRSRPVANPWKIEGFSQIVTRLEKSALRGFPSTSHVIEGVTAATGVRLDADDPRKRGTGQPGTIGHEKANAVLTTPIGDHKLPGLRATGVLERSVSEN
jgi:hypothetical protein